MPIFFKKAIKGRFLAFHEIDTLPQVTCVIVSWLRSGLATKSRRGKKPGKCVNLKHSHRVQIKTHMTKSVKFYTLPSGKGTGPLLETSLNPETHIHVANFLPRVVL